MAIEVERFTEVNSLLELKSPPNRLSASHHLSHTQYTEASETIDIILEFLVLLQSDTTLNYALPLLFVLGSRFLHRILAK